jgi:hypothetical protein
LIAHIFSLKFYSKKIQKFECLSLKTNEVQ